VFAVLEKSKIFKVSGGQEDNRHVRNVNAVISFVFGLFAIASVQTVRYIQDLIVNVVLLLIFLLVVLILLGFIFGEEYLQLFMEKSGDGWKIKPWAAWGIGGVIFLVALGILLSLFGAFDWVIDWFEDLETDEGEIGTVIVLLLIGAVLYIITKGDSGKKSE
jgi:amino acid transporter